MHNCSRGNKSSLILEMLSDDRISILKVHTSKVCDRWQKLSVIIHWHGQISRLAKTLSKASVVILFTKTWSTMYNTSTCILGYEFAFNNSEAFSFLLVDEIIKKWSVRFSNKIFSFNFIKNFVFFNIGLFKNILKSWLSNHINLIFFLVVYFYINEIWVDCKS